jgi:hypothetical protein
MPGEVTFTVDIRSKVAQIIQYIKDGIGRVYETIVNLAEEAYMKISGLADKYADYALKMRRELVSGIHGKMEVRT